MSTNHAQAERRALCDLFLEVGPDAPTLCGEWSTRDLAAHLVIRERRPDAAVGILVPPASGYGERIRVQTGARPWDELVATVRSGPPGWSPMRLGAVDRLVNTNEFFIHHEDVRRAQPGWQPRTLDADLEAELWDVLRRLSKLTLRRAPTGVVLDAGDGRRVTARDAQPSVEVRGPVGELVLFTSGRQAHSRVELSGPDDAVERLRTASLGI
jgi:uncharacterized protein (TIGR03085 family)